MAVIKSRCLILFFSTQIRRAHGSFQFRGAEHSHTNYHILDALTVLEDFLRDVIQ
jgi:hypothetical protein